MAYKITISGEILDRWINNAPDSSLRQELEGHRDAVYDQQITNLMVNLHARNNGKSEVEDSMINLLDDALHRLPAVARRILLANHEVSLGHLYGLPADPGRIGPNAVFDPPRFAVSKQFSEAAAEEEAADQMYHLNVGEDEDAAAETKEASGDPTGEAPASDQLWQLNPETEQYYPVPG